MSKAVGIPEIQFFFLGVLATEHLVPVRIATKHLQDLEVLQAPLAIELYQVYQLCPHLPLFFDTRRRVITLRFSLLGFNLIEQVNHVLEDVGAQLAVLDILAVHQRHDNKQTLEESIRFKELNLVDDVLGKFLRNVVETESSRHSSVDVP